MPQPLTENDYAKIVLGKQRGEYIDAATRDRIRKDLDYYNKRAIDMMMEAPQKQQAPQFMSLTNSEGRVIDVLVKPDGTPQVVEPKTQNTQQGIMTMVNPTNAVPVVNPQTGQPIMGYAADPMMGDAPQTIGAYGAQPQQSPAPSPTPQAAPMPTSPAQAAPAQQSSQLVRVIAPDGRTGSIPAAQVDQALQQGFRLAP